MPTATAKATTLAAEKHVALYDIVVDGEAVDDRLAKRVREVRVLNYLRLPDVCTLTATFPSARNGGAGAAIDEHPFAIGAELEIKLGAREQLSTKTLFKGDIVTLDADFGPGSVELTVRALDPSHALQRSRRTRTFQNHTASDIVDKVLRSYDLDRVIDDSGDPYEFVQQDNETDWDFIWRLAERIGYEFVIEDGIAFFREPTSTRPAARLEWPTTLRAFRPRVTAIQQVAQVTLAAQDPKTNETIAATATKPKNIAEIGISRDTVRAAFDDATVHVATQPVESHADGQGVVQALLDKLAGAYVAAEGVCDGDPAIRAGGTIQVIGIGEKFSGTYRVAAATHVLRGGNVYETRFGSDTAHTLLANTRPAASRAVSRFGGHVVVGVVTNNQDPDDMGRVRVRYPSLGPDAEGAWARVLTPSAGNGRGILMLPVVDEEVLVAFEHGDTTRPYVLGSLFNGVDKPGDDLVQNHDGSFAVRSDHKVDVAASEDMKLHTDQKLTIDAGSEITIEAATKLTIKCGPSQIELSSSGVTVSGPMINLG